MAETLVKKTILRISLLEAPELTLLASARGVQGPKGKPLLSLKKTGEAKLAARSLSKQVTKYGEWYALGLIPHILWIADILASLKHFVAPGSTEIHFVCSPHIAKILEDLLSGRRVIDIIYSGDPFDHPLIFELGIASLYLCRARIDNPKLQFSISAASDDDFLQDVKHEGANFILWPWVDSKFDDHSALHWRDFALAVLTRLLGHADRRFRAQLAPQILDACSYACQRYMHERVSDPTNPVAFQNAAIDTPNSLARPQVPTTDEFNPDRAFIKLMLDMTKDDPELVISDLVDLQNVVLSTLNDSHTFVLSLSTDAWDTDIPVRLTSAMAVAPTSSAPSGTFDFKFDSTCDAIASMRIHEDAAASGRVDVPTSTPVSVVNATTVATAKRKRPKQQTRKHIGEYIAMTGAALGVDTSIRWLSSIMTIPDDSDVIQDLTAFGERLLSDFSGTVPTSDPGKSYSGKNAWKAGTQSASVIRGSAAVVEELASLIKDPPIPTANQDVDGPPYLAVFVFVSPTDKAADLNVYRAILPFVAAVSGLKFLALPDDLRTRLVGVRSWWIPVRDGVFLLKNNGNQREMFELLKRVPDLLAMSET